MWKVVRALAAAGTTVLLTTQYLDEVFLELTADRATTTIDTTTKDGS